MAIITGLGLVCAAGVVVGVLALARDEPTSAPARSVEPADPFAALAARPLRRPGITAGLECPDSNDRPVRQFPWLPAEAARGDGPIYLVSRAIPRFLDFFPTRADARSWRANETLWLGDPTYRGPVVVRGAAVYRPDRMRFGSEDAPSLELHLPAEGWDETASGLRVWGGTMRPPAGWRAAIRPTRVSDELRDDGNPSAGTCFFLQVDGTTFSDTIIVGALVQP